MNRKMQKGNSLIMVLAVIAIVAVVFVGDDVLKSLSSILAKSEVVQEIASKIGGGGGGGKGSPGPTSEPTTEPGGGGGKQTPPPGGSTPTPTPVGTPNGDQPYQGAPLCPDSGSAHDNSKFHGLWDYQRRCHYDHEHGNNPFTSAVANMFPGFNLRALLGNTEVGHSTLSSPLENTQKHGGFKWNVSLNPYNGCNGYQGSRVGVNGSVIQFHNFGDYSIEMEARVHTAAALMRQCRVENPTDYGYVYLVQFMDYGQRVVPYQGTVMQYPNRPIPGYDSGRGAYFSIDCVGTGFIQCRSSLQDVLSHSRNANSIWTTQAQGFINNSRLFEVLFRIRDNYQLLDFTDLTYPFTFKWLCSNDGGSTYSPRSGCRYNNSASAIHEVYGTIPSSWDNLAGFDRDSRVGRITADGFVTRFGGLNTTCTAPSSDADCFPIKMVNAFVGYYGSHLIDEKINQFQPSAQPERDVYFCNGRVCDETDSGATSSGWIGQNN